MSYYYLAGPMTGRRNFNFPAFDAAAADLRAQGLHIVSPAELDRVFGFDPRNMEGTSAELDALDWDRATAIRRDLDAILHPECRGVYLLPGWLNSRGSLVELALAKFLHKEVWEYE